jgi:Protein of unknown function (DUF2628)
MAIYTVHEPPQKAEGSGPEPERFVFVRDGFSFWAFLLAPLWMLRHRMWLVLVGYIVIVVAMHVGLRFVGASTGGSAFASFMLALLVGMEAGTLRRFTFGRRKWRNVGTIVGSDRETVERRFFDAWVRGETLSPMAPAVPRTVAPAMPPTRAASAAPDVIGLFPQQPGAHR